VDFGVLGPLRIVEGDREILLPRQKHRALLAFLVLHAGELVSVDRLLD
jgi:DNA-binding SARP family transcriptional activator